MMWIIKVTGENGALEVTGRVVSKKVGDRDSFKFIPSAFGRSFSLEKFNQYRSTNNESNTFVGAMPGWARGPNGTYSIEADTPAKALWLVQRYLTGYSWAVNDAIQSGLHVLVPLYKTRTKATMPPVPRLKRAA